MKNGFETLLKNARMDVEYSKDFLRDLETETETRKLWRAWGGLLENYVKAVGALRHATDGGRSKAWSDKLLHTQRTDPYLAYAFQFRNSDKHVIQQERGIQRRSASIPGFIHIEGSIKDFQFTNNKVINSDGTVTNLPDFMGDIKDGRMITQDGAKGPFVETEHFVRLTTVHDGRSKKKFEIPNSSTAPEHQAIELGHYICNWLQAKLNEATEMAEREKKVKTSD